MRLRASVLCGAALLVAGCSTTTQGSPATSSTAPAALFNPCDIPDDALRAAGVDPGTERKGIAGAGFEGWEICSWEATAGWYFLTVFSTEHTFDEMRNNSALTNFADATTRTRRGVTSVDSEEKDATCNFAFPVEQGVVMVGVGTRYTATVPEPPCTTVLARSEDLDEFLPK